MRKEVFLGMTIGGGVLAVIIGYVIFNSGAKHDRHGADVAANTDGDSSQVETVGPVNTPLSTTDTPASNDKTTKLLATDKSDPWSKLLGNAGVTVTPDGSGQTALASNTNSELPGGEIPPTVALRTGAPEGAGVLNGGNHGGARTAVAADTAGVSVAKPHSHRVQKGETFTTIAAAAYGNGNLYKVIMAANPNIDPRHLKPGVEINLPDMADAKSSGAVSKVTDAGTPASHKVEAAVDSKTEYRVVQGDSLNKISMKIYGRVGMVDKIYDLNKAIIGEDKAKLKLGMVLKLPQAPVATTN